MSQKIQLKFEGELYTCELPTSKDFTGQVMLVFNWFQGRLMKSEIVKSSSVKLKGNDLSTVAGLTSDT